MSYRMSYIGRRGDSSRHQFRIRTPVGVLERARGRKLTITFPEPHVGGFPMVTATVGAEVKFSLKTHDPDIARTRKAFALAEVERFFASVEAGPVAVSHRELVALSGAVYRLYVEASEDEPGAPERWATFKALNRAIYEGRILSAPALRPGEAGEPEDAFALFGDDLTAGVDALPRGEASPEALESRFGLLVDWLLSREGIDLSRDDRRRLLLLTAKATQDVGWRLKRASLGDYSPDPNAARFPPITRATIRISLEDLWGRWSRETAPSASTLSTWRDVWSSLQTHVGGNKPSDIKSITPDDIIAWKDSLVGKGLIAKTINDGYLAAAKALLRYARRNRLLAECPVGELKVAAHARAETSKLAYSDEEAARLLHITSLEKHPARRWLPVLAATTGSQIGEVAQI